MHLASSDDTLAPVSEATYQDLRECHPQPYEGSEIPLLDDGVSAIAVGEEEVSLGVRWFRRGSAGSPNGLRPQHLKDILSVEGGRQVFLPALTSFI